MKVSKKGRVIISVLLTIAMVITMLPSGQLVKAADESGAAGMNINIHYYDKADAYAGKVYMQYWQPGTATVTVDVCILPPDSVDGIRCTLCTPDSNLSLEYAPSPLMAKDTSL